MKLEPDSVRNICTEPEVQSAYNDGRFHTIDEKSREIRGLARELNEMSHHKFGELLGDNRLKDDTQEVPLTDGTCWADVVIHQQNIAIGIIKDTIERISIV